MKQYISITLLFISFTLFGHTQERLPILMLDDCVEKHSQQMEINQCEYENYRVANKALGIFYLNLQNFLPKEHQSALEATQLHWENFSDSACTIYAARYTESEEQQSVAKIHCLNHKIEERIDSLVYLVMLWEEDLGSFQNTLNNVIPPISSIK